MNLRGRGILLTRPREQAQGRANLVEAAGGRAILFPAIEIQDVPLRELAEFDLAIFVSPTAVKRALAAMKWPPRAQAAALGRGTQRELERHGIKAIIAPDSGADSEALLGVRRAGAAGRPGAPRCRLQNRGPRSHPTADPCTRTTAACATMT